MQSSKVSRRGKKWGKHEKGTLCSLFPNFIFPPGGTLERSKVTGAREKIVEWRKKKINRKKHSMHKAKTLIKKAQDSVKQNKTKTKQNNQNA